MAVNKKEITSGRRSFVRRSTPRRMAHVLAVLIYSVSFSAAAVDSETWYYGMDNVGNITSRGTDADHQNTTHNYGYDGIYRLTNETNPSNADQYSYDPNSNRTSFTRDGTSTSYQIDPNSNRLDQVGSDPRTYDAIGNTKTDRNGTRTFTYNKAGRLSQVHEDGQLLATYTYNAHGQRTIKTIPSGITYYLYGPYGQLMGEYDETGQPVKEYVHLTGEPIAQLESSKTTYLHADHLATPRKATNGAGDVVWKWDSEAFGNKSPESSSGTEVNLRFPGQYHDSETGLYYNYFRYYDPKTGRYITSDPIWLAGGLNTYGYVSGNPLHWIDPYGLDETLWGGPGRSYLDGPRNGNWGGKNWSGGRNPLLPPGGDGTASPTDSADECYMNHDVCYGKCEELCDDDKKECIKKCDRELVNCLNHLDNNPRNWPKPPRPGTEADSREFRREALRYFGGGNQRGRNRRSR